MMLLGSSLSHVLGSLSICSWMFAQIPQVIKNIQNQSCDGLALTFLANWLFGDTTNLIGCLLTNQLPFQTILAAYFVLVDFGLLSQYFYYDWKNPPPPQSIHRHARYRTDSFTSQTAHSPSMRRHPHLHAPTNEVAAALDEDVDEVDENALAALSDSFHSEGGRSKRISWGLERSASARRASTTRGTARPTIVTSQSYNEAIGSPVSPIGRGRSRIRDPGESEDEFNHRTDEESASTVRQESRASRRGASIVFLSIWAMYGLSSMINFRPARNTIPSGRVIGRWFNAPLVNHVAPLVSPINSPQVEYQPISYTVHTVDVKQRNGDDDGDDDDDIPQDVIIGRIFAWVCTTSYLTSRLPQIYKNYARKSVEGLSMFLFVSAFLGNVFYVASILTAPQMHLPAPEATAYLKESMPFLLGSGGTLMFDFTIVTQSFIYKPRKRRHGSRRNTGPLIDEETARLLDGDHS